VDVGEAEQSVGGGVEVVPELFDELGARLGDKFREPDSFHGLLFPGFDYVDELEGFLAGLVTGLGLGGLVFG
jgi:hypothetical protein